MQIVQAQRWLDKNKNKVANNDYSGIDNQDWDPAVKALARFPDVIKMMSDDLDWTTDLGDAEVNQPEDVADVIQELRARAEQNGVLKTTEQQTVTTTQQTVTTASGGSAQQSYIEIQPTEQRLLLQDPYRAGAVGARRRLFLPHHRAPAFRSSARRGWRPRRSPRAAKRRPDPPAASRGRRGSSPPRPRARDSGTASSVRRARIC